MGNQQSGNSGAATLIPEIKEIILLYLPLMAREPLLVDEKYKELFLKDQKQKYSFKGAHRSLDKYSGIRYNYEANTTWIVKCSDKIPESIKFKDSNGDEISKEVKSVQTASVPLTTQPGYELGDRVFLYPGQHILKRPISKDTSIVGIESGVDLMILSRYIIGRGCRCHLENLNIEFPAASGEAIIMKKGSALYLRGCTLSVAKGGIHVSDGATLIVEDCIFEGGLSYPGIEVLHGSAIVEISNSLFRNFGSTSAERAEVAACIHLSENNGDNDESNESKLECVGNWFKNNSCYPIGVQFPESEENPSEKYGAWLESMKPELQDNSPEDANSVHYIRTEAQEDEEKVEILDA